MTALVSRRLFPQRRSFFGDLGSLHRDLDSLFEGVLSNRPVEPVADWTPQVETYLKDDTLHVRADLPGVDPKAVDISVENDVLTLSGERRTEHEDAAYREVSYGRFERRIRVPEGTNAEQITAKFANGVLQISVPLPKPVSKKIAVKVDSAA